MWARACVGSSIESPTDALGDDCTAYAGLVVPEAWRKVYANIALYVPTSACPADLKRARDVATGEALLHVGEPFSLQGIGMTYGATDEKLELYKRGANGDELVTGVTVSDHSSKINFTCTIPAPLLIEEDGEYFLRLTTKAGTDKLWPIDVNVKVEKSNPSPSVTGFTSDERTDGKVSSNPKKLIVSGSYLGSVTQSMVSFKVMDDPFTIPNTATWTITDGSIVIDNGDDTINTGGTGGDRVSVTITPASGNPITFQTELA